MVFEHNLRKYWVINKNAENMITVYIYKNAY